MNIATMLVKPAIKKLFNFSEIEGWTFEADKVNDTLKLIGWGVDADGLKKEISQPVLKLSENRNESELFMSSMKASIPPHKELLKINLTMDFLNKECRTVIYYISLSGEKLKTPVIKNVI